MELPNKEVIVISGRGFEMELCPENKCTAVTIVMKEATVTAVNDNSMMYIDISQK